MGSQYLNANDSAEPNALLTPAAEQLGTLAFAIFEYSNFPIG